MQLPVRFFIAFLVFVSGLCLGTPSTAATMSEISSEPFGTFNDVEFVRYIGRFEGTTSLGDYDVPFEIVAPADLAQGNGVVLVEPPHFAFAPVARDIVLGRAFLFDPGFSYASVGFGHNGLNVLDPSAAPIIVAGEEVQNPGVPNPDSPTDTDIVVQFVNALKSDPDAISILGHDLLYYSFGFSQTAAVQLQILFGPGGPGLFDFNLRTIGHWPEIIEPENFDRLMGDFVPPAGVGRTIFAHTESELIRSDAEQFRNAVGNPDYRVYEIAGAPHLPQAPPLNPLDYNPVLRAAFVAGDQWVRFGLEPPPSVLISESSGIDPMYGFETGIARDFNGNALGGVRLPPVEVGQALYIATNFLVPIPGMNDQAFGLWVDLKCEPLPDGSVRFPNHGEYINDYIRQANLLANQGYLLADDAEAMKERAAESDIGKPGSCD